MAYGKEEQQILDADRVTVLLPELKDLKRVKLSGGEVLLCFEECLKIVSFCSEHQIETQINTNAVMEFEDKSGGSIAGRETTGVYQKEHKRRPWNNRFVLEQFLHSISCQDMEYEKLADYHVHAESLDFVNRFLNCGASYERIFIYDW